jgi:hypothetical protein
VNRCQCSRYETEQASVSNYVETSSGMSSHYAEYMQRKGTHGYEIEHIWADHPERHTNEFNHPNDFYDYRSRIGGLLLLPKSFNVSYGDLPYTEKREHWARQRACASDPRRVCTASLRAIVQSRVVSGG